MNKKFKQPPYTESASEEYIGKTRLLSIAERRRGYSIIVSSNSTVPLMTVGPRPPLSLW